MKSSIKGQEKGDLLIQVTVWVGFTIYIYIYIYIQWNLSNPTHQGTREMCRIIQDV
jgi:hypothetical protein